MPKRALEDFTVGETAVFARTFTEADVTQFVGITWDVNPYHTNGEFCETQRVGRRIVPGLLIGSMLTHVGGLAAVLATEIRFEFLAPVYIGDTVTATCSVTESDDRRGWARIEMIGATQDNRQVIRGTVAGYPAGFRARAPGQS